MKKSELIQLAVEEWSGVNKEGKGGLRGLLYEI
jgi:hypothetical protein